MKKVVEVTSLWILFCMLEPIIMCYLWIVLHSRRSSLSVWDHFMNGKIGLKLQKKQVMPIHILKCICFCVLIKTQSYTEELPCKQLICSLVCRLNIFHEIQFS